MMVLLTNGMTLNRIIRPKELLVSLLKGLRSSTFECGDLSEEELKKKVAEWLKWKKYMVVLDDI
ncbi:Disease resistance protein RPP13 [Spatholobus suberectus]|nr:Disease resistance protein RPP13 [Spatholobus suberectus]